MSLNIKNDETYALIRQLARRTGESLTQAVTTAVRERLERLGSEDGAVRSRAEDLLAIGRDTAPRLTKHTRSVDHGELLYDKHGLPR